ncbi:MAG: site-specific integrase [Solirubrobacterales bacterium]
MTRRRVAGRPPRQNPYKRTYTDGRVVWIARYLDLDGRPNYAKPPWNGGKSTFSLKGDAQKAIDEALEGLHQRHAGQPETIGAYFEHWLNRHPRSKRTNKTNADRISYVFEVEIEGRSLCEWEFDELRRRQVLLLVDHMLRVEGRAAQGVRGILSSLSTMTEDAIGDDAAEANPFMGVRLRRSDPRIRKPSRKIRVWSFEQMRAFAAGGRPDARVATKRPPTKRTSKRRAKAKRPLFYSPHDYEALLLTPALTGLRLGEFLALRRTDFDGVAFSFRFSAHEGELIESSAQKNHERKVPVPPSLARRIESTPAQTDSDLLFPTPMGKLWRERNFYRDVWVPAQLATGLDPTPHEFRHSYVTHLRAAGIDDADLALVAGHTVETMISVYTHALERSHDAIRNAIG